MEPNLPAVEGPLERQVRPHTPGPWEWWTSCSFRRLSSKTTGRDGDVLHATVQCSDGHPDVRLPNGGWDGPDGRLIAAAPDLLAVLEKLCDLNAKGRPIAKTWGVAEDLLRRVRGIE